MSSVLVTDQRGGVFQVEATFTYGECDRLPYNSLRKVKAKIEQVSHGGIRATALFNLRDSKDATHFVEMLDLFGEDGSFVHGSPAEPTRLQIQTPPKEDDEESARRAAAAKAAAVKSARPGSVPSSPERKARVEEDAEGLEIEAEEPGDLDVEEDEEVEVETGGWRSAGDRAVDDSVRADESRPETLKRVAAAAGDRYTLAMVRERMLRLLLRKHGDERKVLAFMKKNGWKDVAPEEVARLK